jgi:23S rRNA (adenine2030-N6)-methyltransferase
MNYRHAFHAGNFADVVKHTTLALVIQHLQHKPTPIRVIDTHAGPGHYDLLADEATRTGEWRDGIGRLIGPAAQSVPPELATLLEPYLSRVRSDNPDGQPRFYPGSPRLARLALRRGDHLVANELHPEDAVQLRQLFQRDLQTTVMEINGWTALKSVLPPKERRGVVLIDPPFEEKGELDRLASGLEASVRRFATGVYLLWYPIKDPKPIARFHRTLQALNLGPLIAIELLIRRVRQIDQLNGCGIAILNPPYRLDGSLETLLRGLAPILAQGAGAEGSVTWLTRETPASP